MIHIITKNQTTGTLKTFSISCWQPIIMIYLTRMLTTLITTEKLILILRTRIRSCSSWSTIRQMVQTSRDTTEIMMNYTISAILRRPLSRHLPNQTRAFILYPWWTLIIKIPMGCVRTVETKLAQYTLSKSTTFAKNRSKCMMT